MIMNEKRLKTDVLIIGAGGAGLRAAIAAKKQAADVLIVSKGPFPEGCDTHLAGGGMLASMSGEDSIDAYVKDTLKAGAGMNYTSLVKILAKNSRERVLDLCEYGLDVEKEGGEIKVHPHPQCSVPRAMLGGKPYSGDWFQSLVKETDRLTIPVMDQVAVIQLVKDAKGVVGAIAIDISANALMIIETKSMIVASGGAGNLYRFTSNHSSITGDGQVMAYKIGAKLSHLEFMQMRQCIIHPDGLKGMLPPFDGFVSSGGRFYNGLHQRYMKRHFPEKGEDVTRAEITKYAQLEIMAGRNSPHGGVFGDLSDVPVDKLAGHKKFLAACEACNFDPGWQCYEWSAAAHYFMGGIVINEACETGVPGLYAAGEVAAGVQGANRMGGHALTETQVFGEIAGHGAAKFCASMDHRPFPDNIIESNREFLSNIVKKTRGVNHREVRSKITGIISQYVGVLRNQDELFKAQDALNEIEQDILPDLCLSVNRSLAEVTELIEVENLLLLGKLITMAAIKRTESRGAHQRLDYPETKPPWKKHIVFQLKNHQAEDFEVPG
jgi:fumarate reductase (CoM/CoB) subunit A